MLHPLVGEIFIDFQEKEHGYMYVLEVKIHELAITSSQSK